MLQKEKATKETWSAIPVSFGSKIVAVVKSIDWGAALVSLGFGIVAAAKSSENSFFASLGLPFFLTMAVAGYWANYGSYQGHVTKRWMEINRGDFKGLYPIWVLAFFSGLALLGITYQKVSQTATRFFQLFGTTATTIFSSIMPFFVWPVVISTVIYCGAVMLDRLAKLWNVPKKKESITTFLSNIFTNKDKRLNVFAIIIFVLGLMLVSCGIVFTTLALGKSLGLVLGDLFNLSVPTYTWLGIIFGSIIPCFIRVPSMFCRGGLLFIVVADTLAHPIKSSKKILLFIQKELSFGGLLRALAKMLNIVGNAFIAINLANPLWMQILAGIGAGVGSAAFVLQKACEEVVNGLLLEKQLPLDVMNGLLLGEGKQVSLAGKTTLPLSTLAAFSTSPLVGEVDARSAAGEGWLAQATKIVPSDSSLIRSPP